jgi:putative phosphonate metabolism protein
LPDPRYALYFAPPEDSPLWEFASRWLGRDAATGQLFHERDITASPRVYGFHATLKPPFYLRDGHPLPDLHHRLQAFVQTRPPCPLPALRLAQLGSFLALTLSEPCPPLQQLADACVREFDAFRRPPAEAELAERRPGLNPAQLALLERWGYPYVFEEWKFHMTLTSSLRDPAQRTAIFEELSARLAPYLTQPITVDSVCLFAQPERGAPFLLAHRFGFPQ